MRGRTTHDARRTTHDARRTTHDARRTTHDARRTLTWLMILACSLLGGCDACTPLTDFDVDGLSYRDEVGIYGTSPFVPDTDGDGLLDGEEVDYWAARTDGIAWDSDLDTVHSGERSTGDGLVNLLDPDSDNDGLLDGDEARGWTISLEGVPRQVTADPASPDTDGDGAPDAMERLGWTMRVLGVERLVQGDPRVADTDGDTLTDWRERVMGSDPARPRSFAAHYTDASRADHIHAMDVATGIECPAILLGAEEATRVTSVRERFADGGVTFSYEFHFFQPDANGEPITVELASVDDSDQLDPTNSFSQVTLTRHPVKGQAAQQGDPDYLETNLIGGAGSIPAQPQASVRGWYMVQLLYHVETGGRAIRFRVTDAGGKRLPIYWIDDPPLTLVDIALEVEVAAPGSFAYYKGGAYRNAERGEYSYVTGVTLDGNLLYERAFDQGKFSFPLGYLSGGTHVLMARWESSGGYPTKLWESVCEHSFDPSDTKKSWDPVQMLYLGNLHTRDYDAWSEGVAFTQRNGEPGDRPAPVRRGGTFSVALEGASLGTGDGDVKVFTLATGAEVTWPAFRAKVADYTGGYHVAGAFEARQREHWTVTVPEDAPVGRYVLRGYDASGQQLTWPGNPAGDILFYVLYDPYPLVDGVSFTKQELETWAYDEDEDGKQWDGYGNDADHERDDDAAFQRPPAGQNYATHRYRLHAIRRDPSRASPTSVLDLAIAAVDGTQDEMDAMLRLHRLTNQRIRWESWDGALDAENALVHSPVPFTPDEAATYAVSGSFPASRQFVGQCQDFANSLTALARSIGIPARPASAVQGPGECLPQCGLFGWNYHVFTEVFLGASHLPRQGGTRGPSDPAPSDDDPWVLFDANDAVAGGGTGFGIQCRKPWGVSADGIDTRADYYRTSRETCYAEHVTMPGPVLAEPAAITISGLDWDPAVPYGQLASRTSVAERYRPAVPVEYWITTSGVGGDMGWGDKDFFKIDAGAGGATVEAVALGADLDVRLCSYPDDGDPSVPDIVDQCASPGPVVTLGPGVHGIVVFSGLPAGDDRHGNYVRYELRVQ
ncbi:MAG: transglutaminase domain-containing protein [Polyangiaceae bacterium]|nr:transglutaminase domain-containing protein [Polyangiaceae bacterium]